MTGWFFANLAWTSLAMLLVLAVRRPVARMFGAGPAYGLWLLPALRLVLPPLPLAPPGLPPLDIVVLAGGPSAPVAQVASAPVLAGLVALWAGGVVLFVAWQFLAYRAFLTRLSLSASSRGSHDGLPLVESAAVPGPVALGLLDRRIIVPADFDVLYSPAVRQLALDHEVVHHRRGDIWCNLAALLVLAVNWFNPVAWLAFRAFREDQELACDAAVTAASPPEARQDYARALVKAASRPGLIAACPLNHADQLKRRLRMMNSHRRNRLHALSGAGVITVLAGVTASLGAPGLAHPDPEGEGQGKTERIIIMNHKADGAAGADAEHRIRMRHGENGELVLPDCPDAEATRVDEGTETERTRIVLCSRGEANPVRRAEHLQRARDRLANETALSEAQRARVTAALDREIARLRAP